MYQNSQICSFLLFRLQVMSSGNRSSNFATYMRQFIAYNHCRQRIAWKLPGVYGGLRFVITIALFGSALAVPLLYYTHCWSIGLSQGDRYKAVQMRFLQKVVEKSFYYNYITKGSLTVRHATHRYLVYPPIFRKWTIWSWKQSLI